LLLAESDLESLLESDAELVPEDDFAVPVLVAFEVMVPVPEEESDDESLAEAVFDAEALSVADVLLVVSLLTINASISGNHLGHTGQAAEKAESSNRSAE